MIKVRYQNPTVGDEIILRMYSYNSNNLRSVDSIEKIEVYFLDPQEVSQENPDGRRLIETIDGADVESASDGIQQITIAANSPSYVIGNYIDIWYVTIGSQEGAIPNQFTIYPDLWFTSTTPIVYDYAFSFRPNRLKKGSKRYISIEILPNVPDHNELVQYYTNLAITAPIKISIEQMCGPCTPSEADLRLIANEEDVEIREKCLAYYFLDTSDMEIGVYEIWFTMELGDCVYISDRQPLEIF